MGEKIREFVCIDFWRSDVGKVTRFALASVFTLIVLPLVVTATMQALNIWRAQAILEKAQDTLTNALKEHVGSAIGHGGVDIILSDIRKDDATNAASLAAVKEMFNQHETATVQRIDKLIEKMDIVEDNVAASREWQQQHQYLKHDRVSP